MQRGLQRSEARHGDRRRRQAGARVRVVGPVLQKVLLLQVAVEGVAQAVDDGGVRLQPHADPQPVHQHPGDHVALDGKPGLLFDDRGHDQRLVRRAVRQARVAGLPLRLEMPLHRAIGPAQDRHVARAPGEEIGVREEQALGLLLRHVELHQDLGVVELGAVVAQIGDCVERSPDLRERPALDQPDLGLRDIAASQLVEQLDRGQRHGDLVAARLDVAVLP